MKFLLLVLFISASAHASDFRLKGVALGDSPAVACKGEAVTDLFGDAIRTAKEDAPSLREMGTNECAVPFDSFGGYVPSAPVHMLFKDGRLILVKIEMESLTMEATANIVSALRDEYGKPRVTRSDPFTTLSWRKGKASLEVERVSPSWDENHLIIILRDEPGYKSFTDLSNHNKKQLDALARKARRNMITQ